MLSTIKPATKIDKEAKQPVGLSGLARRENVFWLVLPECRSWEKHQRAVEQSMNGQTGRVKEG
jgi:hypothetical protein